jgi:hypothetical protein
MVLRQVRFHTGKRLGTPNKQVIFCWGPAGNGLLDFRLLLRLTARNTTRTTTSTTTLRPMSNIVARLENKDPMVWATGIVLLTTTELALNHPELLLYCQVAVAATL